jgi:hypothetical protein
MNNEKKNVFNKHLLILKMAGTIQEDTGRPKND